MTTAAHKSRGWRWVKRGVLGLFGFLILVVGGAIGFLHTAWGRQVLRDQVASQLQGTFVGGATLGTIDGSPFGTLVLHDLVINGPDKQPAISVKTLAVELGLLPLISHQVRVGAVTAQDVDIDLRRDADGQLEIAHLTKPGPKSTWSIDLPKVALRRAHIKLDAGTEVMNFDDMTLDARARLPNGGPIDASLEVATTWRERGAAPLDVRTVVHSAETGLSVPYLQVHAGDVSVIGNQLTVVTREGHMPTIGGGLIIDAGAAAVARLVPSVRLPDDIAVTVNAIPEPGQPWTDLAVVGSLGKTPIWLAGAADLDGKQARGELSTGTIDLTKLTADKIVGQAAGHAVFNVRPGGASSLPVATATIRGWGEIAGVPRTEFDIALDSAGERINAIVNATGDGVKLALAAKVRTLGELLTVEAATLKADVVDPAKVSGGKAPVHGSLHIDLAAHGTVRPEPSFAVSGTIDGRRLRVQDFSVGRLHLAIDAQKLPSRPLGKAHVELFDLVRQNMQLGALTVDAADRTDGKIAVQVRSRPVQNPWLFDLDALITPPAKAAPDTLTVDLTRHRVRAGNGTDWTGHTGHVEVGPERVVIRDLQSTSAAGHIAVAGFYDRAGRLQGDFRAKLDATGISLTTLAPQYHGSVDAHVEVGKHRAVWDGDVEVDGKQLSLDPSQLLVETHVHAALHGTKLAMTADATSLGLGSAKVALDIDTPAVVTDARAWKKLGRDSLRIATLTLADVQVRRLAELAGLEGEYGGKLSGDFKLSPDTAGGRLELREVVVPQLRGLGGVNVVLDLTQTSPTELAPSLTASVEGVGRLTAQAQVVIPDKMFDPVAWRALGRGALRGASVRIENVAVDPAMLDRLGIASELRANVNVAVDVGEAANTVQATVAVGELRGAPLVQPIDIRVVAGVDDKATTTTVTVATSKSGKNGATPLLEIDGKIPGAPAEIIARIKAWKLDPRAGSALPLAATLKLPAVNASRLLAVFGRTEIVDGQLDGTIELGGTLAQPTAKANIVATGLKVPPGRGGKPVRTVQKLAITGTWDGDTVKADIDGLESDGGSLKLTLDARPSALREGKVTLKATNLDLVPILAFAPGPAGGAGGELNADLRVTGLDPRTMQIAGELHLKDARVPVAPNVGTLRRAKIDAVIADHQITLGVDGKLGRGTLAVTGTIALDGAAPNGGKAKITLRKVSPIGVVEPQISADISATLAREGNQWHANLVVDHGNILVTDERGEKLKPTGAPDDMRFINGDTKGGHRGLTEKVPEAPVFVVSITMHPMHVESTEFRGELRGKLEIKASGEEIGLVGGIDADSGDLDLFGRRYYIERAGVHFDGPMDPLLDVRITHDFSDVTTITEVRGRLSKPELVMSSDPGTYSQGQLLGFLLGGDPAGDPMNSSSSDKVADAGTSFVANKLGGYVRQALPISIDVLRYENATATSSAAVTVGTWITHTLFLAYRQHLESRPDENTGEGSLEYWLTRRIMLEGTAGDRGYDGVDLLWRKRY